METSELADRISRLKSMINYCFSCNACNTVCPTNQLKGFAPREFLRKLTESDITKFNDMISKINLYECLTCGQCMVDCPMYDGSQGVNFTELMQEIREYALSNQISQDLLNECLTHQGVFYLNPNTQVEGEHTINSMEFIRSNPQLKVSAESDVGVFIGCFGVMETVFNDYAVDYREMAISTIKILNLGGIKPVVFDTKCCGHDVYWAGETSTAIQLAKYNIEQYKKAKIKTLVVSCAEGYEMWKNIYPKLLGALPFEVKHLSEIILERQIDKKFIPRDSSSITITYHDPCRLGRLSGIYDAPRQVLTALKGVNLIEMENTKENAQCCGVSSFLNCTNNSRILRELRLKDAAQTGASTLVTTCPKCITHFSCYLYKQEFHPENNSNYQYINERILNIFDFATFIVRRLMI